MAEIISSTNHSARKAGEYTSNERCTDNESTRSTVSKPTKCEVISATRSSESMRNASDETSCSESESTNADSTNADGSEPRSLTTLTVNTGKSTHESTSCRESILL